MGVVFKATHSESGQVVAVKILSQTGTQDAESVDRFQREGQIAASISHPRSTFVYAAGEQEGQVLHCHGVDVRWDLERPC